MAWERVLRKGLKAKGRRGPATQVDWIKSSNKPGTGKVPMAALSMVLSATHVRILAEKKKDLKVVTTSKKMFFYAKRTEQ